MIRKPNLEPNFFLDFHSFFPFLSSLYTWKLVIFKVQKCLLKVSLILRHWRCPWNLCVRKKLCQELFSTIKITLKMKSRVVYSSFTITFYTRSPSTCFYKTSVVYKQKICWRRIYNCHIVECSLSFD